MKNEENVFYPQNPNTGYPLEKGLLSSRVLWKQILYRAREEGMDCLGLTHDWVKGIIDNTVPKVIGWGYYYQPISFVRRPGSDDMYLEHGGCIRLASVLPEKLHGILLLDIQLLFLGPGPIIVHMVDLGVDINDPKLPHVNIADFINKEKEEPKQ